jgi:hypothetical protein
MDNRAAPAASGLLVAVRRRARAGAKPMLRATGGEAGGQVCLEFLGKIFHHGPHVRRFPLDRRHPHQRQVVLHEIVEQSRSRSAVYDVLTNGVPVQLEVA